MRSATGLLIAGVMALAMASAAMAADNSQKRILVVTHTNGFRHSSIPTAEKVLGEMASKSKGMFVVDYCRTQEDVKKMLVPEFLQDYDGVFFANTTGNLQIPDLHAFLQWIRQGHAFFGAHSASDTYHPSDTGGDTAYVDMLGGEFMTHHQQCQVSCIVQDLLHPSVVHLGKGWDVFDEIYLFRQNNRDKVHVLLYLDKHPNDGSPDAGKPGDYMISWCKRYGGGRVFYTALGHREDVWENEKYQQHLLGAMKWALGLEKGLATPGPRLAN